MIFIKINDFLALEEREKFKKNAPFFLSNTLFSKIVVFDLQTTFSDEKTVFFRLLAEIRLRTLINCPKKASSPPKRANSVPPAPCLKLQSECSLVKNQTLYKKCVLFPFD